jgi:hypothetical protein
MGGNDSYFVRVTSLEGTAGLFIWEICSPDGRAIRRSTKSFTTRVDALLDSTQAAAALALETPNQDPSPFG